MLTGFSCHFNLRQVVAYRSSWTPVNKVPFPITSPLQETQKSIKWLVSSARPTAPQLTGHSTRTGDKTAINPELNLSKPCSQNHTAPGTCPSHTQKIRLNSSCDLLAPSWCSGLCPKGTCPCWPWHSRARNNWDTKVWGGTRRKAKLPSLVWMLMASKGKLNVFCTWHFSNGFLIYSVQQSKLAIHKVTATLL